jgi:hypothetical protein
MIKSDKTHEECSFYHRSLKKKSSTAGLFFTLLFLFLAPFFSHTYIREIETS